MRNVWRLLAGAVVIACLTQNTSAKHRPALPAALAPAQHNFVGLDLAASAPAAPAAPALFRAPVTLLDTASATRLGDTVNFEALTIAKTFGRYMSGNQNVGPPDGTLVHSVTRYAVSCDWRTIRLLMVGPLLYGAGQEFVTSRSTAGAQDWFLGPRSLYLPVIDHLCAGDPLKAAKGFGSADAAVAAWTPSFPAPPPTPIMPPAPHVVARANLAPLNVDGTDSSKPHNFVRIEQDTATGNVRYLDRGTLVRQGQTVTALSFSLLGPQAQYWSVESVAVLQKVTYACDAHTMTILGQSEYDRFQDLTYTSETTFNSRSADAQSQIEAACSTSTTESGLASIDAIWAQMRSDWPPHPLLGWTACMWNNLPADRRQSYVDQWTNDPNNRFVVQQSDLPGIFNGCAIPELSQRDALNRLGVYATQRAALARLSSRKLDEQTLLSAWRAVPYSDKLRVIRAGHTLAMDDIQFQLDLGRRLAAHMGIGASDSEGLALVRNYVMDQAFLEGS